MMARRLGGKVARQRRAGAPEREGYLVAGEGVVARRLTRSERSV
jgi:hypothetical protein